MSSRKYYFNRRPIRNSLEFCWRPICLIEDPLETKMPDQRPTCLIGDRHAFLKPAMTDRNRHASSETDIPYRRPIGDSFDMLDQV